MIEGFNVVALWKTKDLDRQELGEKSFWVTEGPRYVDSLMCSLRKHLAHPFEFLLLTDAEDATTLFADARIERLIGGSHGWWAKMEMFRPELQLGKTLYVDLDNVVTGSLDRLTEIEIDATSPIVMADDVHYPGLPNGSVMLFDGRLDFNRVLWDSYTRGPKRIQALYSEWPHAADQSFIAHEYETAFGRPVRLFQEILGPHSLMTMRDHLERGIVPDETTRMLIGATRFKPHLYDHPYVRAHWPCSAPQS